MTLMEQVKKDKIIAIVRGLSDEHMLALAEALCAGGITMMEVTFNQAKPETWQSTCRAISIVKEKMAGRMKIGAGTVMTLEQLHLAKDAGAEFVVSPNVNPEVIRHTKRLGMGSFPGALTPSEAAVAYESGADAVKLFPAGSMGEGYLKALKAPLAHIDFLAVGGVNENNAAAYIRAGAVGLGVGGNLVNKAWIEAGELDKITELAAKYRKAVDEA